MTQARVAEIMGVDRAYISALERGERNPTAISLWHTAEALGVHVACLFNDEVAEDAIPIRTRATKKARDI